MSLLFTMLARLVTAFLLRSKCLLISCLQSPSDFGAQENSLSLFPLFLHLFVLTWWDQNWCFWTVVLEKTLESPLDSKEIVNPKRNQPWTFIGRTDAEAAILWPPDVKNWLIGKYPDPGKSGRQEKGMTEDEMAGWHHWLDGHEFEQAPGVGDIQGSLARCSAWHRRVGHDWATELSK